MATVYLPVEPQLIPSTSTQLTEVEAEALGWFPPIEP